jgi:hypothetical protein
MNLFYGKNNSGYMKPECFSQLNRWTAVLPFMLFITSLWAQHNEGHFRFGLISLEVKGQSYCQYYDERHV